MGADARSIFSRFNRRKTASITKNRENSRFFSFLIDVFRSQILFTCVIVACLYIAFVMKQRKQLAASTKQSLAQTESSLRTSDIN